MKTIFVGNLNFRTSDAELRALFAPHGEVVRVSLPMSPAGLTRGFGFVEMRTGADEAIAALHGTTLAERTLTVNEAKPRSPVKRVNG